MAKAKGTQEEQVLDLKEAFIEGSFAPAKKGRSKIGKTKRDKGSKIMAVGDRNGLSVAMCVESATPDEGKLAVNPLVQMVIPDTPQNLAAAIGKTKHNIDADCGGTVVVGTLKSGLQLLPTESPS